MQSPQNFNLNCPLPLEKYPRILLAHGGGGKLMHQLIQEMFFTVFPPANQVEHDATVLAVEQSKIAFTTDSYVVNPLFFAGGDIGSMAVYGTVNDLAMSGAKPLYLSLSFILEEGLEIATLWEVIKSIKKAAELSKISIVAGDTKVVEKGKGDGIFINTSGIGTIEHNLTINPLAIEDNDAVILSGDIGRHGIAIMAQREGLEFETSIESDCAPLAQPVLDLIEAGVEIHCLRDLTRGGLASALNEIALSADLEIAIAQSSIKIIEEVQGACEILGFDPLYIANEGRFVAFVPEKDITKTLSILQNYHPDASLIGHGKKSTRGLVTMKSHIGGNRIVDMLSGEQLPRIC